MDMIKDGQLTDEAIGKMVIEVVNTVGAMSYGETANLKAAWRRLFSPPPEEAAIDLARRLYHVLEQHGGWSHVRCAEAVNAYEAAYAAEHEAREKAERDRDHYEKNAVGNYRLYEAAREERKKAEAKLAGVKYCFNCGRPVRVVE